MTAKAEGAFRTISEVSAMLDVPAHVLRFWESKFKTLAPLKRNGGRRYYRPDVLICSSVFVTFSIVMAIPSRARRSCSPPTMRGRGGPLAPRLRCRANCMRRWHCWLRRRQILAASKPVLVPDAGCWFRPSPNSFCWHQHGPSVVPNHRGAFILVITRQTLRLRRRVLAGITGPWPERSAAW